MENSIKGFTITAKQIFSEIERTATAYSLDSSNEDTKHELCTQISTVNQMLSKGELTFTEEETDAFAIIVALTKDICFK